jgi:hypothetical protein
MAMLDTRCHSHLADAAADMMRAYALATTRAATSSMVRGMSFWSWMLTMSASQPSQEETAETSGEAAFACYRSAGGHAVAQAIVPDAPRDHINA